MIFLKALSCQNASKTQARQIRLITDYLLILGQCLARVMEEKLSVLHWLLEDSVGGVSLSVTVCIREEEICNEVSEFHL